MLHPLINRSPDLLRLTTDGYELEVKGGHALMHHVPYVNSRKEVAYGALVSPLTLLNDKTVKPQDHVMFFTGEAPCRSDGTVIAAIQHQESRQVLDEANGIVVFRSFSNKPENGYPDYYEKFSRYAKILSVEAQVIDPKATAITNKPVPINEVKCPFVYYDTNSIRAGVASVSEKLRNHKIAIVGLGGTGSYILDFVSKTWVSEINIIDGDVFLQHNAFRTPGAAPNTGSDDPVKKVVYLKGIYEKMHRGIKAHAVYLDSDNMNLIDGLNFVFVCVDDGDARKRICEALIRRDIPFIDVGMGLELIDDKLTGNVRLTSITARKNDHVATRIPFMDAGVNDYAKNIQIAELNALNATLAVIKWKKLFGIYHDLESEHHASYSINSNEITNDETYP